MKKRIVASVLCLLMLLNVLCGCTLYYSLFGYDTTYTGPTVEVYLSDMPTNIDPLYAYTDDSVSYILSLIFEGLYKYDKNGKVEKALAKSYKKTEWNKETGEFQIEITLKDSSWNDQAAVSADQFIYAWRRFLDPQINSTGAVLLYDIKNAKNIKTAADDSTKYDLGATAVGNDVLRIDFEPKKNADGNGYAEPDLKAFFEKLASPLLVPLRSEGVSRLTDWACSNSSIYCNGPFFIKSMNYHEKGKDISGLQISSSDNGITYATYVNNYDDGITLERNRYYYRDLDVDPVNTYVEPYSIRFTSRKLDYIKKDDVKEITATYESAADRALVYYKNGDLSLLTYIPLSERATMREQLNNLADTRFTHSYYFNTNNPLFAKAEVRQALSMVIDRTKLAESVVYAKAASSIVSPLAFENGYSTKTGGKFNDNSSSYYDGSSTKQISATAGSMADAKALLAKAGVTSGSFTITIKAGDEVSMASALYCRERWTELGFTVTIRELGSYRYTQNTYDGTINLFNECFYSNGEDFTVDMTGKSIDSYGDSSAALQVSDGRTTPIDGFDVIAVDLFQPSTDAFTVLAPFSKYFSGGALDLSIPEDEYDPVLPITSYDSEAFNDAIMAAFNTTDSTERAKKLHEAEAILMTDLPVMPLFNIQTPLLYSSNLKGVKVGFAGLPILNGVTDKNYKRED